MKRNHIFQTILMIFAATALLTQACTEEKSQNEQNLAENPEEPLDPWAQEPETYALPEQMDRLIDSIHVYEQKASASENEKIESTLKFIDEIESLAPTYDRKLLEDLKIHQAKLARNRYQSYNMQDTSVMLRYDALCDELEEKLLAFKETVPDFERYSRAELLFNDIMEANKQDFFIRKDYNYYVQKYNTLLKKEKDELKALGRKYDTLKKAPYFYEEPIM